MRFVLLAVGWLALDQWSKWLVMEKMAFDESIPIVEGIFHLSYVKNPGAAFGMLAYETTFFIVVTLAIIAGIAFYFTRISDDRLLLKTGLALQVSGAVGNLIDRLRFGYVIDFLDFRVWPVFNVADVGICIGVGILILEMFRTELKSGQGEKEEPRGLQ
ncbi:MAG TPA: signal peptidase II [Desulfobacteria bacterium]|nr:signal peptidase II [Desulfobacteria bacterium]